MLRPLLGVGQGDEGSEGVADQDERSWDAGCRK
jgi:hypothetical protein